MDKSANLKDLGLTLEELYNNDYQINIHLSDKPYAFHIILKDRIGQIDCKISSFGANLWTRTEKGKNYLKYSRLQDLQSALKRAIRNKVDTEGDISFSKTEDICQI